LENRPWHAHYDDGVPADAEWENVPISAFVERAAERFGDRPAFHFLGRSMDWRTFAGEVRRAAAAFAGLGLEPGSAVAIHLPTLPQTAIAYYAALYLGARVVLTNPLYTPREIEHQWHDAGCELAITADFLYAQTIEPHREKLPVRTYVVCSIPDYMPWPKRWIAPFVLARQDPPKFVRVPRSEGVHGWSELLRSATGSPPRADVGLEDVAVLQYTGGTTGVSKAAVLTHANLSINVQQVSHWFQGVEPGREVILVALPLFHVFGMTVGMNWAAWTGAAMVLIPNPRDTAEIARSIQQHRVTIFPGVPAMFNALNHLKGIDGMDLTSVKSCFSGSAPLPLDVLERFEGLTGSVIVEGFGLSESSPVSHVNPLRGERKLGSVGLPVTGTDAKIVDVDDGTREIPTGEEGELVMRGPQVMREYWRQPEETANTLRDGWLFTGDLATVDEDGYFRIVGRKKDMINCSGLKVFPDEVDAVLAAHDAILEAATIGVPHEKRGETVKSFVVLQPGATLEAEDVVAYCRENLARYKVPRDVEFLDELPKSSVLKVLRRELRDREIAKRA
jgi:long-chain acyl-CoA synthetase